VGGGYLSPAFLLRLRCFFLALQLHATEEAAADEVSRPAVLFHVGDADYLGRKPVAEAQADPCRTKLGSYQVIRGGSWTRCGYRQRATRREFNNQDYPCHGFRVALPEAGGKKIDHQLKAGAF